jgi:hypothetical protein
VNAPQRAAADGKILAEGRDNPAVNYAHASHDAIGGHGLFLHAEIVALVLGMKAGFLKGAGLEKFLQAVTGGHQAFFVAGIQFVLTPARPRDCATFFELV